MDEKPPDDSFLIRRQTYFKQLRKYVNVDTIYTLQSIDWGAQHCVFVDKKNRVFTFGQKRYGKLGLDEQPEEEEEEVSSDDDDKSIDSFKYKEKLLDTKQDWLEVNN